jgi:hypothetical protein
MTLDDFDGPVRSSGDQLHYKNCPSCGSQNWKTYLDPATGKWFCHAGNHGAGGRVDVGADPEVRGRELLQKLRGDVRHETARWGDVGLPPYSRVPSRWARTYLRKRGVEAEHILKLGIAEGSEEDNLAGRILLPYTDARRGVIHWTGRAYTDVDGGRKYMNAPGRHPLYVPGHGIESGPFDHVVVVEGPFDAIRVWQAGFTAAALGGKHMPSYLEDSLHGLGPNKVTVMLDKDATLDAMKLARRIRARKVRVVKPPADDPGDSSIESLQEVLEWKS